MPVLLPAQPISLKALQRGDADAWRTLFETYAEPLYLYAYHRCDGDGAAADDIRQETFLAAIEAISTFRAEVPLFGWLCGIARNKVVDRLRRQVREKPFDSLDGAARDEVELPDPAQVLPEMQMESAERSAAVVEALWSLPEEYRQVLVWRYARGEPVDQIAGRMQRTYKAVESLLTRARVALRERLREHEPKGRAR